jgi:hypothetical protein
MIEKMTNRDLIPTRWRVTAAEVNCLVIEPIS